MFFAQVRVFVKAEHREAFEKMMIEQAVVMKSGVPGLLEFRLFRPADEDSPHINYSVWESEAAMAAFEVTAEAQAAQAAAEQLPEDTFTVPPVMETFESIDY